MEASDLDRRIEIFRQITSFDEYNAAVVTWSSVGKMWASCEDVESSEGISDGQVSAVVNTIFKIRYRPDIRPDFTMKVVFEKQEYQVERLQRLPGRGEGWQLSCILQDRKGVRGL